ncbi:MAG: DNA polymerase III [Sulfuricurvum sp. MLSB]|uniref:DNA-processing protein DprA n=1 Tax=unclassified Sulfuricurvum TaxID=2632390 RepID=UPI0005071AA0|nr:MULTISPECIES: DNA-processing protein DprA [unclassified Sulfuricurvum]KFN38860.1 MAG: DNA polymerase III [Sulfuricurvum sp. MLSB]
MFATVSTVIPELESMKRYPEQLYYRGSLQLLNRPKISIVGTRRPNPYTRSMTFELSKKLSMSGMTIISGAAMGVDRIAHEGSGAASTVAVLPCGIDIAYPAANAELIRSIETHGLSISPFEPGFAAREWSFVVRNEIVVALGSALIVAEADIGSGSMRSVEYALQMGKPIYVLPHRLRESMATHRLVAEGKATAIEDIDCFVAQVSRVSHQAITDTPFIAFCRKAPTYEEAMAKFPSEIFEAELSGAVEVRNGRVNVV